MGAYEINAEFSEFSYGFAATRELVSGTKGGRVGAPKFPNQVDEGTTGGYDVAIPTFGRPVYLQFKLAEYLQSPKSREYANGAVNRPYYRFAIRRRSKSKQHQLLVELERQGEAVLYMCPEFHLATELDSYYRNATIVRNSAAFAPLAIGLLPDDGYHSIAFEPGKDHGFFCSQPRRVPRAQLNMGLHDLLAHRQIDPRLLNEATIRRMGSNLATALEASGGHPADWAATVRTRIDEAPTAAVLDGVATSFFNLKLVVVSDGL